MNNVSTERPLLSTMVSLKYLTQGQDILIWLADDDFILKRNEPLLGGTFNSGPLAPVCK